MNSQENEGFVNVGMEQPAEVERHDDVVIKVDGPSTGKGWKIAAICAFVVMFGLCAGSVFMFMRSNDAKRQADDVQAKLDASTEELDKFREVTGVDAAADFVASEALDLEFAGISSALSDGAVVALDAAYVKDNGDYQVARFDVYALDEDGTVGGGHVGFFYRVLPDGEWKKSGFSGQQQPVCADLTAEEIAAFEGVEECSE